MKKHFYSHIIEIDSVYVELDLLDMKSDERHELRMIVESSVHHVVLDTVMSHLSEEDKKQFLSHLTTDRHDKIWELLNTKVPSPETKIRKAVDKLKKELHTDIQKAKKKKRT